MPKTIMTTTLPAEEVNTVRKKLITLMEKPGFSGDSIARHLGTSPTCIVALKNREPISLERFNRLKAFTENPPEKLNVIMERKSSRCLPLELEQIFQSVSATKKPIQITQDSSKLKITGEGFELSNDRESGFDVASLGVKFCRLAVSNACQVRFKGTEKVTEITIEPLNP